MAYYTRPKLFGYNENSSKEQSHKKRPKEGDWIIIIPMDVERHEQEWAYEKGL